jgi:dihydroxyacid dehydratase/phosphogluconate dehydratase
VIKQSAVSEKMMVHTGPPGFENEEPAWEAVSRNQIKPGEVVVIRLRRKAARDVMPA